MKYLTWCFLLSFWSSVATAQMMWKSNPPKDRDAVREWVAAAVVPVSSFSADHQMDRVKILGRAAVIDGVLGDEAAYRSHIAAAKAVYTSGMEALGASLMNTEARSYLIYTKVLDNDLPAAQRIASERDAALKGPQMVQYAVWEKAPLLMALCRQKQFDKAITIAQAQPEAVKARCLDMVATELVRDGASTRAASLVSDSSRGATIVSVERLQALLEKGNWAEARPLIPVSWAMLAVQILVQQGKFAEATEAAELSSESMGRDSLLGRIAGAKVKAGDLAGAKAMLGRVKDQSYARHSIALQLLDKGQVQDAMAMVAEVSSSARQLSDFAARLAKCSEPAKAELFIEKLTDPHALRPVQLATAAAYLRAGNQTDYQRLLQPVLDAARAGSLTAPEAESELRTMVDLLGGDDLPPLREVWQAISDRRVREGMVLRVIAEQLERHGADAGRILFDQAVSTGSVGSRSEGLRMITWTLAKENRKADAIKMLAAEKDPVVKAYGCMGFAENLAGLAVANNGHMSFPVRRPPSF